MFRFPTSSWICASLALVLGTSLCSAAPAKNKKGKIVVSDEGSELHAGGGTDALKQKFNAIHKTFESFATGGAVREDNKQDQQTIKLAAQWYTYRLTWLAIQDPEKKTGPSLKTVHHDLNQILASAESRADKKFLRLFTRRLLESLTEVLKRGNLQAQVNAALMLPRLCQAGRYDLLDGMVALLKSNDFSEATKLYAIKGLAEIFQKPYPPPGDDKEKKVRDERFAHTFKALLPYLDPKLEMPSGVTRSERTQIENMHRFFRREAIRALGQMRVPAISISKTGKVDGPIAYHLARVLTGKSIDGKAMSPRPSVSEQLEAAVALCQMRSDANSPYRGDVALYLVGRFVANNLVKAYDKDAKAFPGGGIRKNAAATMRARAEPWKVHATRLDYALDDLAAAIRNAGEQRTARTLWNKAQPVFKSMQGLKTIDNGAIESLAEFVKNSKPKGDLLFKGLDELKVPLDSSSDDDD